MHLPLAALHCQIILKPQSFFPLVQIWTKGKKSTILVGSPCSRGKTNGTSTDGMAKNQSIPERIPRFVPVYYLPKLPCIATKTSVRKKRETEAAVSPNLEKLQLMFDPRMLPLRLQKAKQARTEAWKNYGGGDFKKSFQGLFELTWYSKLPCFDITNITSAQKDDMSMIWTISDRKLECKKDFY